MLAFGGRARWVELGRIGSCRVGSSRVEQGIVYFFRRNHLSVVTYLPFISSQSTFLRKTKNPRRLFHRRHSSRNTDRLGSLWIFNYGYFLHVAAFIARWAIFGVDVSCPRKWAKYRGFQSWFCFAYKKHWAHSSLPFILFSVKWKETQK